MVPRWPHLLTTAVSQAVNTEQLSVVNSGSSCWNIVSGTDSKDP